MSNNQRLILTFALCLAVMAMWQLFFAPPLPPPGRTHKPEVEGSPGVETADKETGRRGDAETRRHGDAVSPPLPLSASPPPSVSPSPSTPPPPEETLVFERELYRTVLTNHGAGIKSWRLSQYRTSLDDDAGQVDLVSVKEPDHLPPRLSFGEGDIHLPADAVYNLVSAGDGGMVYRWRDGRGLTVDKSYRLQDSYNLELTVALENEGAEERQGRMVISWLAKEDPKKAKNGGGGGFFSFSPPPDLMQPTCSVNGKLERVEMEDLKEPASFTGRVRWAGVDGRYFLQGIIPRHQEGGQQAGGTGRSASGTTAVEAKAGAPGSDDCAFTQHEDGLLEVSLSGAPLTVPPAGKVTRSFVLYLGPKEWDRLKTFNLDEAIDFGWFGILARPMLWLLNKFYWVFGNYGLAIILLTVVVKVLIWPLTQKSFKSMEQMKKLKPEMDALKGKYGQDKQRLNQEMMKLYKEHKINPLGGCLPMLLQMPIWIALYRMLWSTVELYQAPFIPGWIEDLSSKDPYYIMPILLGATMFLQQRLTPQTMMDSTQAKMMMYFMPAFFTLIMLSLPSGLVLYIFVSSILSIAHQWLLGRNTVATAPVAPNRSKRKKG